MKVANTKRINSRIQAYIEREEFNRLVNTALVLPICIDGITFENPEYLLEAAKYFKESMEQDGVIYTEDEATIAMMITTVIKETLNAPHDELPLPAEILNDITKESKVFHQGCFDDNAYLKNIHFDNQALGRFELSHSLDERYTLIMYSTPDVKYHGITIPRIGTFDHNFSYPDFKEDGHVWMSVTPNEIFTNESSIKEAKGNVLTLGCGMGYWAYMVSEKDNVNHVTIIEKEPEVIELFNTFILPQFAHKEKITIIHADAFEYMEKLKDDVFDYCFADIWRGNDDIMPYIKLKQICGKFRKTKMSYWIENALASTITHYVYIIIFMEFCKNQAIPIPHAEEVYDDVSLQHFNYLQALFKDEEITKVEHVDFYMNPQNITALLSSKNTEEKHENV